MGLEPMISPFSLSLRGEEVPLVCWLKIFSVQNPFTLGNMLLRTSCTLGRKRGGGVLLKRGRKPTCSCIGTMYNGKESAIQLKELQHYRGENDFFFHLTAERFLERLLKFSKACFSVCLLIQKHQIEACRYRHCPFGWHFIYRKLSLLFLKMLMWGKCSFLVSQWNNVLECLVFKVHPSITAIEFDLYALDT